MDEMDLDQRLVKESARRFPADRLVRASARLEQHHDFDSSPRTAESGRHAWESCGHI